MPRGCVPNALPIDDGLGLSWVPDVQHLWETLQGLLAEEQAEEGGVAVAEEEDEEDQRRRSFMAGMVVSLQAPELVEGIPEWPGLFLGQAAQEEGREVPTSKKAQGKAPTVELLPPEMDVEMAGHL